MKNHPTSSRKESSGSRNWVRRSAEWSFSQFRKFDLHSGRSLLFFWFLTRILIFVIWVVFSPSAQGDVLYYYQGINSLFTGTDPSLVMREYPTPVLWMLAVFWLTGFGTKTGYVISFIFSMVALDALFSISLWHTAKRLAPHAVVAWIVFVLCCGPTIYMRFDLVTSVFAGWCLLFLLRRHTAIAGCLAAVGASVKLWPALLWPALCGGHWRQKLKATYSFALTGIIVVAVSLLWAGWDRLVSPLSWQSGRGLQVESVWATVPMLLRALGIGDYAVLISRYQAFEVYGTTVSFWTSAASIAFVVGVLLVCVCYGLWLLRGHGHMMEASYFMLLVILVMIVTNKTFSPQYAFWLGGPLCASFAIMGARAPGSPSYVIDRRRLWIITAMTITMTAATGIVYPIGYGPLVRDGGFSSIFRLPVTLVLVSRNVLIVALLAVILYWIFKAVSPRAFKIVRGVKTDYPTVALEPVKQPEKPEAEW